MRRDFSDPFKQQVAIYRNVNMMTEGGCSLEETGDIFASVLSEVLDFTYNCEKSFYEELEIIENKNTTDCLDEASYTMKTDDEYYRDFMLHFRKLDWTKIMHYIITNVKHYYKDLRSCDYEQMEYWHFNYNKNLGVITCEEKNKTKIIETFKKHGFDETNPFCRCATSVWNGSIFDIMFCPLFHLIELDDLEYVNKISKVFEELEGTDNTGVYRDTIFKIRDLSPLVLNNINLILYNLKQEDKPWDISIRTMLEDRSKTSEEILNILEVVYQLSSKGFLKDRNKTFQKEDLKKVMKLIESNRSSGFQTIIEYPL